MIMVNVRTKDILPWAYAQKSRPLEYTEFISRFDNEPITATFTDEQFAHTRRDGHQGSTLDRQTVWWTNGVMYFLCHMSNLSEDWSGGRTYDEFNEWTALRFLNATRKIYVLFTNSFMFTVYRYYHENCLAYLRYD